MATDDEVSRPGAGGQTSTDTHPPGQASALNRTALDRTALDEATTRTRDRIARRQADKFTERREQLAAAALATLAEQGYANTSLRDIAQHSDFSHGVLHYYFADKFELIGYCVRQYKSECVTRYDDVVASATSAEQLLHDVGAAMAGTVRNDATVQRLWYDLRNQALFDERFRATVTEIDHALELMTWRFVSRYAELSRASLTVPPALAYGLVDGLFYQSLLAHFSGDPAAADTLEKHIAQLLPALLA
jgi:AcrR family transcriptional regulator